jgi:hypothetical protein
MVSSSVREKGKKKGGGHGGVCILANTKSHDTDCPVFLVPPPFFFPFMTREHAPFRKARSAEAESLPFFSTVQVEIFLYLRGIIVD